VCVLCCRYPYYLLGQLGVKAPYWLTWLRYSAFIVLYPIGIVAEVRQPDIIIIIYIYIII
jgi:hypothetical protein